MNNATSHMNKLFKTIASAVVIFVMVITIVATPAATVAAFSFDSLFGFDTSLDFDASDLSTNFDQAITETTQTSTSGEVVVVSESSLVDCALQASKDLVEIGEDITLDWYADGFSDVTINGDAVTSGTGSLTISNLREQTVFTLEAIKDNGDSCVQVVIVDCEPPELPVRCTDYGYDFEVVKYDWNGSTYVKGSEKTGYVTTASGDTVTANWTANPAVAGVLAKAGTTVTEFAGGTAGTVNKSQIGDGTYAISNFALCGNDVPEPKECILELGKTVDKTTATPGELVTYTITVENVGTADCTGDGVKIEDVLAVQLGYVSSQVTSNLTPGYAGVPTYTTDTRTLHFNGNTLTPGEAGTITWVGEILTPSQCGDYEVRNQAKATALELSTWVYSPEVVTTVDYDCTPDPCELVVEKSVDKITAVPGDVLTYTITVKNTGDASCTGSGVKIEDVLDTNLKYLSHTLTSNLAAGYVGTPVYTSANRTLHFNGFELEAGESGTIVWEAKVLAPEQCGDFTVSNQAKATALELDNFNTWALSQIVVTAVDNDCDVPKTPECTLTPTTQTVEYGSSATLSWTTKYASAVTLSEAGVVQANGSVIVGPITEEKFYVLTATGDGGKVTCPATIKVGEPGDEFAEVIAQKIVCTDELELPNYGNGGPAITASTAADWVAAHDSCALVPDWKFQWTDSQTTDPGDTVVGEAALPWHTFGPTDATGETAVTINLTELGHDRVWFREVLQEGYIPFTHDSNGGTNVDYVSAEFYCDTDVINYDNRDSITAMEADAVYHCVAWNAPVPTEPLPSCDLFTATPATIMVGASTTLSWETSNAVEAFLNNGIGAVDLTGSVVVSPIADLTYVLTLIGTDDETVDCEVPVKVSEDPVPVCEFFTATPNQLLAGGGTVAFDWKVSNADTVTISPTIGSVALVGTTSVSVLESTTFTLTAEDDNGDQVSCVAPVTVPDSEVPFTCAANVSFFASDNSINRGQSTTLTWSTTGVDTVSISGINATSLSGAQNVSPANDATYVLTATQGEDTVTCPVSIDVSSGGGGGGSSSPRCELDISDNRINRGEEITLSWDTTRATEVTLSDDQGNIIFTTDDYLSSEKADYYDGSVDLRPTRNTEYTLVAERGSRDAECSVEVKMVDDVVVIQTRDQQPLVAGISLSQVPYTGFEAGPIMTVMFYLLLVAWAFYVTYLMVIRNKAGETGTGNLPVSLSANQVSMQQAETVRPDVFVAATTTAEVVATAPSNLPTGTPVVGYESQVEETDVVNPHQVSDSVVTALENRAHAQKALLSSDAVRHFVATTEGLVERNEALDEVISEAKSTYPLEDGWIVINELRMRNLCDVCAKTAAKKPVASFTPATVPQGSSSLAEAIVTGNVVAAYSMIGNRPMFSLADAAADFDALYRYRQGTDASVSELLKSESAELSDEQIKAMISALTSALDGTYTDEASAVKMAIMKAVKALV